MRFFKRIVVFLMVLLLIVASLFGCNSKDKKTKENNTIKYDQSCAFGMGDVLLYNNPSEKDIETRIKLMGDLGIKSLRFWLRVGLLRNNENSECFFRIENNQLVINEKHKNRLIYAVNKLYENGIKHITFMCSNFYGINSEGRYIYYGDDFPLIGTENYRLYMETLEYQYKVISETFKKEITKDNTTYFEMGNEMNYDFSSMEGDHTFSNEDKATIVLDSSYYSIKGIKKGNPDAKGVLNGLAEGSYYKGFKDAYFGQAGLAQYIADFIDLLYTDIESNKYPTTSETKSNKIEDFFEVLAWHPYSADDLESWIEFNDLIYQKAIDHGDEGRPVFITEYGKANITSEKDTKSTYPKPIAAELYSSIIKNIDKTPYIEAVHIFILSDFVWEAENTIRDNKTFCLVYNNGDGTYELSKAYLLLKEEMTKKGE